MTSLAVVSADLPGDVVRAGQDAAFFSEEFMAHEDRCKCVYKDLLNFVVPNLS